MAHLNKKGCNFNFKDLDLGCSKEFKVFTSGNRKIYFNPKTKEVFNRHKNLIGVDGVIKYGYLEYNPT